MTGAIPGVKIPRTVPRGRIIIASTGAAALLEILTNPGAADAAEIDSTWRGLPPDKVGRVECTERTTVTDYPRWWNLFGENSHIVSETFGEWADYGDMKVKEAIEMESTVSRNEIPAVRNGYYRVESVCFVCRFNGSSTRFPNPRPPEKSK